MNGWDWNNIDVVGGEWWLLLIGLLIAGLSFAIGYWVGYRTCEKRILANEPYPVAPPPPPPTQPPPPRPTI